jgi:hypothetical protein
MVRAACSSNAQQAKPSNHNHPDKPLAPGRTPDGKFAKGNPGGPGNPHARECARILQIMQAAIADEEILHLTRKLLELGLAGDVAAIKLILAYKIGKPQPAPLPDHLAHDGWSTYVKSAVKQADVLKVMQSPPAGMMYDIAQAMIPFVEESHKNMIMDSLGMKSDPKAAKAEKRQEHKAPGKANQAPTPTAVNGDPTHQGAFALEQAAVNGNRNGTGQAKGQPTPTAANGKKTKKYWAGQAARLLTERLRNGPR